MALPQEQLDQAWEEALTATTLIFLRKVLNVELTLDEVRSCLDYARQKGALSSITLGRVMHRPVPANGPTAIRVAPGPMPLQKPRARRSSKMAEMEGLTLSRLAAGTASTPELRQALAASGHELDAGGAYALLASMARRGLVTASNDRPKMWRRG